MTETMKGSPERIILSEPGNPVELRQLIPQDATDYFALVDYGRPHLSQFNDPTAEKYPTVEAVAESIVHPDIAQYRFGMWVDSRMVGSNSLTPQSNRKAEIGSWVGREFIGHNYAAHGRALLVDFGFRILGLQEIISMITVGNEASRRSVEKSGFTLRAVHGTTWVYSLPNPGRRST